MEINVIIIKSAHKYFQVFESLLYTTDTLEHTFFFLFCFKTAFYLCTGTSEQQVFSTASPVLTSSLMSSSFIRMVMESSLIFCCACRSPLSEQNSPPKPLTLSHTELSPMLLLAGESIKTNQS